MLLVVVSSAPSPSGNRGWIRAEFGLLLSASVLSDTFKIIAKTRSVVV